MKAILKTIKPKQCANIMNLIQSILVIKDKREATAIQKLIDEDGYADIYVYCTKGNDGIVRESSPYSSVPYYSCVKIDKKLSKDLPEYKYSSRGKVIFKFRCYNVEEIYYNSIPTEEYFYYIYKGDEYDNEEDKIDTSLDLEEKSCLNSDELDNYLQGKTGYAIHISDLEIFDKPKELSEVKHIVMEWRYGKYGFNKWKEYHACSLTKAPSSWCYVEVE